MIADRVQVSILEKHLYSHDAEILSDMTQLSHTSETTSESELIIVPHTSSNSDIPPTPNPSAQEIVTDFWVEKCLHRKEFVDPSSSITNAPFQFPIPGNSLPLTCKAF